MVTQLHVYNGPVVTQLHVYLQHDGGAALFRCQVTDSFHDTCTDRWTGNWPPRSYNVNHFMFASVQSYEVSGV